MRVRNWQFGLALLLTVTGAGSAMLACGGTPEPKFASVKAGPLPTGQSWDGVYYNPVYGYLHVVSQDGNIVGRWKRTDASHWGELSGTIDGNVAHFSWKEYRIGSVDPSGEARGSGVFVYKLPNTDHPIAELDGQYALAESSSVGDWHCVKQEGMKPDLASVNGSNVTEVPPSGDHWQ
jgi:hypothetical protein